MRALRLALTKGRIENDAIKLLESRGFDCLPLTDKGRKLIVPLGDSLDVVFAKAVDVLTYVKAGVCDMGIVGKDTIMETGGAFLEVTDLGFGKCKMCVAAPVGAELYTGFSRPKIATKFPHIAADYFAGKQMDVEIIQIDSSVELAPILGLAHAIVDIVQTGDTLRENGLEVVDEFADISTRFIVNMASFKMRTREISELIEAISAKEGGVMAC